MLQSMPLQPPVQVQTTKAVMAAPVVLSIKAPLASSGNPTPLLGSVEPKTGSISAGVPWPLQLKLLASGGKGG